MILMQSFSSAAKTEGSVIERNLILSRESEAFEISSLKKISLFEQKVLIISDNNWLIS